MKNNNKTKEQLILEIEKLKNKVAKQKEVKKTYKETDKKTFFYQNSTIEILEHILDGIVIFDKNMNYVYVNKIAAELLGSKPANLTGKNYWKEYPEAKGSVFANNYVKAIETQTKLKFESYYEVWDRWFENRIYPFQGGIIILFTEITQHKKAEKELIKAKEKAEESNRLITAFLHNMNHEVRTPMNGIMGFSEFLSNPDLTPEKRQYFVSIIQNSSKQLLRIIDEILEISKLETKQVKTQNEKVCLNDLLMELFSIFDINAKENNLHLHLKNGLTDNESTIFTDKPKLNKIISNLLENALKFTNTGFVEFGYNLVKTHDCVSQLEIYVKDTGIGISQENQKKIFNRFSQEESGLSSNAEGLGLGLSITKENTELLGGKITLKSEKGKGSTFFVTIPYKPVNNDIANNKTDINKVKTTKGTDNKTILIVEDEKTNTLFLETVLEIKIDINCKILQAKNGEEAVDICKKQENIDLVFMDLKMPVMSGFEATKKIKEFRSNLPIVALTAYSVLEDKEKAFLAGCDDFISKPIKIKTINKIVNKYLT